MFLVSKLKSFIKFLLTFFPIVGAALTACCLHSVSYLLIRPISLILHRRIYTQISRSFFLSSTFLLEIWSSITFKSYGDRLDPTKSYLAVINHRSDIDWLLGIGYISHFGSPYPGNAKSVVKASLARVPLFGYLLWFAEFLFLMRDWGKDKDKFLARLDLIKGYPKAGNPMWLVLYPEGTRLDAKKLEYSASYAQSKGLQPTHNVLFPRYKAFTAIVRTLRDQLDGVVDSTFIFEGKQPKIKDALAGTADSIVHTHMKYYPMSELPEGEQELEKWLLNCWYEKDHMIQAFLDDGPSSLGEPDEGYFGENGGRPSVMLFYALFAIFQVAGLGTIYACSKIPNGLYFLFSACVIVVALVAIFVVMNITPSRKGSKHTVKKD